MDALIYSVRYKKEVTDKYFGVFDNIEGYDKAKDKYMELVAMDYSYVEIAEWEMKKTILKYGGKDLIPSNIRPARDDR